ncbi:MAG: NahK/ErcS family hybrid sensor histidine kinase/response regulator [Neptuniibacter sp.]
MKKHSDNRDEVVTNLLGLGNHSTRKSYYPELVDKLEELEEEKNRYKWLFENALHGIFQAELHGTVLSANPSIATILGYPSLEIFQASITHIGKHLFANEHHYTCFCDQLHKNGNVRGMEVVFQKINGELIHIAINALIKNVDSDTPIIEAFVQDITERKLAQNKLKRLNEELEMRVDNRTQELVTLNDKLWQEIREREQIQQELKVAKDEAVQANNSKDKYLAAASHDLLQPMNAARLLISALRERKLPEDDSALVERVHLALDNAEELLTDLLDISKLDQQAVKPDINEFYLSQILSSLSAEFQPVAENKGLKLDFVECSAVVRSDSRLLVRIIRNFISNAIRYTDSGRVLLGCRRKNGTLSIEVWDTGGGIPQDKIDHIFQEFQQLECDKGRDRQGVGLGLAIVDRIAKILDHKITVRSEVGKGSVFSIELPVAKLAADNRKQTSMVTPVPDLVSGASILVIDNEENILASMYALLQQWGCNVCIATTADEAIQQCREDGFIPEIILADFHLDDDALGTDAIAAVRKAFELDIPGVMLTADRSAECRQLFKSLGLPVLNKPVKPGKLRALITHLK